VAPETTTTSAATGWKPTKFKRLIRQLATSTATAHIETDDGEAFIKTLGNPEGPDALVCEWVGTRLAAWLKLPTLEVALVDFPAEPLLAYPKGCHSLPGPAFFSRAEAGRPWDGSKEDLLEASNANDVSSLVVFDTWTRNCDRHFVAAESTTRNLGNVFFSERGARAGKYLLRAIDHTACFRCHGTLNASKLGIDQVRDERVYGLFEEFTGALVEQTVTSTLRRLAEFTAIDAQWATSGVPTAWGLSTDLKKKLEAFCVDRASFVSDRLASVLRDRCGWHATLPLVARTTP